MSELLKAIQIVKKLNHDRYSVYEQEYNGGTNTLNKAYNKIMQKHGIETTLNSNSNEMSDNYSKYEREILDKYEELIDYGVRMRKFHDRVYNLLINMESD